MIFTQQRSVALEKMSARLVTGVVSRQRDAGQGGQVMLKLTRELPLFEACHVEPGYSSPTLHVSLVATNGPVHNAEG